jgi:peptidoglycan/LPS O-acetylase OafA/YrhL
VASVERAFPALDGLRAVAATAVVTTHVAFWTGSYTPDLLGHVLGRLDVGVAVFFVLSGFLLSRPLFRAAVQRRPGPRAAAYLWRRALRILPAYWLTVAAALLLLPANRGAGPVTWMRHLALVQSYDSGWFGAGLTHTWSLVTEVAFYLVLPLAGAGLVRLSRSSPERPARLLAALGAATLAGLGWLWTVTAAAPLPVPMNLWLPGFAGWFAAGMAFAALSVADRSWRPVRVLHTLGSSPATCWAVAGALFWILASPLAGPIDLSSPTPAEAVVKNVLDLGVAALAVLPLVFGLTTRSRARDLLSGPGARFLGEISYPLFLGHVLVLALGYPALGLAPFTGNLLLVLVATWLVSVAVASAVYVLVERPLRRWRGLVPATPPRPIAETATAESATSTSA